MISITVISEKEEDRDTIQAKLASYREFKITGVGKDGYDALKIAAETHPDIMIMDHSINDLGDKALSLIIKARSPSTACILLSSSGEAPKINKALQTGISGYLLKETDMDKLAASVRTVFYGGCYISAPIINRAFSTLSKIGEIPYQSELFEAVNKQKQPFPKSISYTERQILIYVAYGYRDKEIAASIKLNIGTVRNYLSIAMRKAGLQARTQVVIYALKHGLIDLNRGQI
jgi:DNA-binding NarL/FixJ family response regulator